MKCLAIGGCHMAGYPIGYDNSFIYKFSKHFASEVHVEANFPLSHSHRIESLIRSQNPDLVMLQLGNYEFDASIKKTVRLWAKKFAAAGKRLKNDDVSQPEKNEQHAVKTTILNRLLFSSLQWICLPFTGLIRRYLVTNHVRVLKGIIHQHPAVKFILLTPLPVLESKDNWVRKCAGSYFKLQFRGLDHVSVIDTHDALKSPPVFADPSHLNEIGHVLLQCAVQQHVV